MILASLLGKRALFTISALPAIALAMGATAQSGSPVLKGAAPPKPAVLEEVKPADAGAAAPARIYKTETQSFDNWSVRCLYLDEALKARTCTAQLNVTEKEKKAVIASLVLNPDGAGGYRLEALVPTNALIKPGVELNVGKAMKKGEFEVCQPSLCAAAIPTDFKLIDDLKSAVEIELKFVRFLGETVRIKFPAAGLTKAIAAMNTR